MERGTEWESEVVQARWRELERRRTAATRLLGGLVAFGFGWLLVLLAMASEVCLPRTKGTSLWCRTATPAAVEPVFLGVGLLCLGSGVWVTWTALRS